PSVSHLPDIGLVILGGLLVALTTALLLDRLDPVLVEPSDIEAALGLPVLGVLPAPTDHSGAGRTDACAELVSRIEAGASGSLLMVVSCGRPAPARHVAGRLAGRFAESRRSVLLVQAGLRRVEPEVLGSSPAASPTGEGPLGGVGTVQL